MNSGWYAGEVNVVGCGWWTFGEDEEEEEASELESFVVGGFGGGVNVLRRND